MRKISRAQEQLSLFNFKTATKVHDWNPARADISDHTIETPCLDCGEKMDHPNHASMGTPEPFTNARNSNKTAGAWPSEVDHDNHIDNMQELADHHAKGVAWHSKRGDMAQAGRHGAALAALTGAIEACKQAK